MSLVINRRIQTLTEPVTQPERHARIGYRTWTRERTFDDISVTSEAPGFPKDAPLRPDTYERWKPDSVTGGNWQVDLGVAYEIDYVAIGAHNAGTLEAAVVAEFWQDGAWHLFAETAVSNNNAIMFIGDKTFARWWRIMVNKAVEIGVVHIGPVLAMTRPIYGGHAPAVLARQTTLTNSLSREGHFLGQTFRKKGFATTVQFQNLRPDWYRTHFDPFVQEARRFPFFFAWRPGKYDREVVYCWVQEDIQPSNMGVADLMEVSFSIVGFDD